VSLQGKTAHPNPVAGVFTWQANIVRRCGTLDQNEYEYDMIGVNAFTSFT
jgi:hypothetical protein